jgi:transketolase
MVETMECWQLALEARNGPAILALSRQNLPAVRLTYEDENLSRTGAYELSPAKGKAQASIFASGSEVQIAMNAQKALAEKGIAARVVSVPCLDLFLAQDEAKRKAIIGDAPVKIAVEAGIRMGWDGVIGSDGLFVGMDSFGTSAPMAKLYAHFGITAEAVTAAVTARLTRH